MVSSVPSEVRTVIISLFATSYDIIRSESLSTTIVSGVTKLETTASPSPHAALIIISLRLPLIGFNVNIIPDESENASFCTTTASATISCFILFFTR